MTVLRMYFTVRAIKHFIVKNCIFERLEKVIIPKISVVNVCISLFMVELFLPRGFL